MKGRKHSISRAKQAEVCKCLNPDNFRVFDDIEWIKQWNNTPLVIRRQYIKLLELEQTRSIIKGMHELQDSITVPYLGKFSIKTRRKEFIMLRRNNPDMPVEEVAEIIKADYDAMIKRKQEDKRKRKIQSIPKLNLVKIQNKD